MKDILILICMVEIVIIPIFLLLIESNRSEFEASKKRRFLRQKMNFALSE